MCCTHTAEVSGFAAGARQIAGKHRSHGLRPESKALGVSVVAVRLAIGAVLQTAAAGKPECYRGWGSGSAASKVRFGMPRFCPQDREYGRTPPRFCPEGGGVGLPTIWREAAVDSGNVLYLTQAAAWIS